MKLVRWPWGAQVNGWSLYVRDRKPVLAMRRDRTLFELTADRFLSGPFQK